MTHSQRWQVPRLALDFEAAWSKPPFLVKYPPSSPHIPAFWLHLLPQWCSGGCSGGAPARSRSRSGRSRARTGLALTHTDMPSVRTARVQPPRRANATPGAHSGTETHAALSHGTPSTGPPHHRVRTRAATEARHQATAALSMHAAKPNRGAAADRPVRAWDREAAPQAVLAAMRARQHRLPCPAPLSQRPSPVARPCAAPAAAAS
eukprot:2731443-Prymnesium_polylepis.1